MNTEVNIKRCLLCEESDLKEEDELKSIHLNHCICLVHFLDYVKNSISSSIKCPSNNCEFLIPHYQIQEILSTSDYEKFLNRSLTEALKNEKTFKCLNSYCKYPILIDENNSLQYDCPKCKLYNCVSCKATHKFMSCSKFQLLNNKNKISQDEIAKKEKKMKELIEKSRIKANTEMNEKDLLNNFEPFECPICKIQIPKNDGVIIRRCGHNVCKKCLKSSIIESVSSKVPCPHYNCQFTLEQREIMALLNEQEKQWYIYKDLYVTKLAIQDKYVCKTSDCTFFYEKSKKGKSIKNWKCQKCQFFNCELCQHSHEPESQCITYDPLNDPSIKAQIKEKKLMACLNCKMLLQKTRGCNWIQCSSCGTELCWINQCLRWGPRGRGDTSGGCKCGVNGRPCHPDCISTCIPHTPERDASRCIII